MKKFESHSPIVMDHEVRLPLVDIVETQQSPRLIIPVSPLSKNKLPTVQNSPRRGSSNNLQNIGSSGQSQNQVFQNDHLQAPVSPQSKNKVTSTLIVSDSPAIKSPLTNSKINQKISETKFPSPRQHDPFRTSHYNENQDVQYPPQSLNQVIRNSQINQHIRSSSQKYPNNGLLPNQAIKQNTLNIHQKNLMMIEEIEKSYDIVNEYMADLKKNLKFQQDQQSLREQKLSEIESKSNMPQLNNIDDDQEDLMQLYKILNGNNNNNQYQAITGQGNQSPPFEGPLGDLNERLSTQEEFKQFTKIHTQSSHKKISSEDQEEKKMRNFKINQIYFRNMRIQSNPNTNQTNNQGSNFINQTNNERQSSQQPNDGINIQSQESNYPQQPMSLQNTQEAWQAFHNSRFDAKEKDLFERLKNKTFSQQKQSMGTTNKYTESNNNNNNNHQQNQNESRKFNSDFHQFLKKNSVPDEFDITGGLWGIEFMDINKLINVAEMALQINYR
ncbi:UNKNOWN [Stylonychia lemnae]|uniref:Uncharacterized protein n=1 Tax=Stylonychia lemnae TaxID=5949 RepID=A0A078BBD1_STYLE|nr:UNKNOWN [Stylonychia lemnae]|eukprot:CDW91865.1 UNKNOWN [Stylonychia lemnae]